MKIFKYIVLGTLLTGAVSCKKGWLDVTASNQIKADEQFKTVSGFQDALMGVYISMTQKATYGKEMSWNIVDILARQINTLNTLSLYSDVQQFRYNTVKAAAQIDAVWKNQYNTIVNINSALENIDKAESMLGKIEYSIIKGELLGLRAFIHFDLMRIYGEFNYANRPELASKLAIPYITTVSKTITPQRSYQETFELMQNDMKAAAELLKEDPIYPNASRPADYFSDANRNGFYNGRNLRMNYFAVKALQARVYAWQGGTGNLQNAALAAQEVISNSGATLNNPANTLPSSNRLLLSEQLFGLNVNGFANLTQANFDGTSSTNYDALVYLKAATETLFELSNANIGAVDIRIIALMQLQTRGYVSLKLQQTAPSANKNIMPLMRLPEMYYIVAEANLTNDLPKAITTINTVRKSRGILQEIPTNSSIDAAKAELLKEYRKEFITEGQLFFYYKRMGLTQIPGLAATIIGNDQLYRLPYPASEIEFGLRVQ